jgi:hypothetical protein
MSDTHFLSPSDWSSLEGPAVASVALGCVRAPWGRTVHSYLTLVLAVSGSFPFRRHALVALWTPRFAWKPSCLEGSQDLSGLLTLGSFRFHVDDNLRIYTFLMEKTHLLQCCVE